MTNHAIEICDFVRDRGGKVLYRNIQSRFFRLGSEGFKQVMRCLISDSNNPDRLLRVERIKGKSWVVLNT